MKTRTIKQFMIAVVALIGLLPIRSVAASVTLSIEDFTIKQGETKEMLIDVNNATMQVTMVEFYMQLPSGLSVAVENGELAVDIARRTTWKKHSLEASITDGTVHFFLYSGSNAVLSDTSGAVISVRLTASSSFTGGNIIFERQLITSPDETECKPDNYIYNVETAVDAEDEIITFADDNVKAICVANWDTNGDGELSKSEAAAVTDFGTVFKNNKIISSFEELHYFTGLTSIDDDAFNYCRNLTSISIPSSVTTIGNYAFKYCYGLTSIDIPNSVTSIGDNAFYDCGSLAYISIPSYVTSIGNYAFYFCSNLTSINIPDSMTSIGYGTFYGCNGLTNITIPGSVTTIGSSAFSGCSNLTSISIPRGVTNIGDNAFSNCSSLTTITVEANNTVYDSRNNCNAIIKTSTNELILGCVNTIIPNSVTIIGDKAFYNCSGLTSINIPNSVTTIGNDAFHGCCGLTSITIPNSVTNIGGGAFAYCSGMISINIPSSVTTIGGDVFNRCSSLTSINIPNSVTCIGKCAFLYCSGLTSIIIPSSVTSIGESAFLYCSGLTCIIVDANNTVYDSRNNCNAIIKTSTNELIQGCVNTIIPSNVTTIFDYAFSRCSDLTSINIPNSITTIGDYAFSDCSGLTNINISNSVTTIGNGAFQGCSGLVSIKTPNSVTTIGNYAFSECSGLTSINICKSVTTIGYYAFYDCKKLTSVKVEMAIPITIEQNVFSNRANATLYVPHGSKAAYEAADYWKEFKEIVEINNDNEPSEIEVTDVSQIDNVIYMDETEVRAGTQATISLKMKNTTDIRGFQFDLYLPEGVTAVKSAKGKIQGTLSDGRLPDEDEHTLTLSEQPDGAIRFLCSSQFEETFIGTDGEVATLQVNVADNMEDGDYAIQLKDVKLTENDISKFYLTDLVTQKLTVMTYISGDISGDGIVDVSDYTGIANYIHGKTPTGFNAMAADVNTDNAIDVLDYTGIANIIHTGSVHGTNHAMKVLSSNNSPLEVTDVSNIDNVLYISPFSAAAGSEEYSVSINMKNTADIRGFQFDLYLPEGVTAAKSPKGRIQGALSAGRLPEEDGHELTLSEQPDGAIRFLCSSQYEETFTGNDGEIATLKVNVDSDMPTGEYAIVLKDVKLTENDISIFYLTEQVNTTMTVTDATDGRILLDETSTDVPTAATNVNVRVKRTINANEWSTICLPFDMTEEQVKTVFGDDVQLKEFMEYEVSDGGKQISVTFDNALLAQDGFMANHPYIIKVSSKIEEFTVDGVTIDPDEDNAVAEYDNGKTGSRRQVYGTFKGTYHAGTTVPNNCLFLSDNKFWYSKGNTNMKAFRGYFDFKDVLEDADGARVLLSFNDETTGIGYNKRETITNNTWYTLDGRKLDKKPTAKGVYVKEGRKVVIK